MPKTSATRAGLWPLLIILAVVCGCVTGGKFGSFDDDGNGLVSADEADGHIYYFNSYDKNKDGGLDQEEFRWAWAATKRRDDKKAGVTGAAPNQTGGGIIGGNGGAGGFGR